MVGRKYEAGGIAKDGAKLVTAVACAEVPKFTVHRRRLVRRRQLRHVRARLRAALPVHLAQCAHLASWAASRPPACSRPCAATISRPRAAGRRRTRRPSRPRSAQRYEAEGNPYYATARLWDDGIILPSETRRVLGLAFSACSTRRSRRHASASSGCAISRKPSRLVGCRERRAAEAIRGAPGATGR